MKLTFRDFKAARKDQRVFRNFAVVYSYDESPKACATHEISVMAKSGQELFVS